MLLLNKLYHIVVVVADIRMNPFNPCQITTAGHPTIHLNVINFN